ncbi:MAG: hypothetical protein P4L40_12215 [Terracidiphilus sp.]|nr:hypothetical protein [Terracidiphilus sp.]
MKLAALLTSFSVLCVFATSQQPEMPKAYDDKDAYQIYSLLLPHQESYEFAKGTLVIQSDTVSPPKENARCMTPQAAAEFEEAVADFDRENLKPRSLQRLFQIEKPYELVTNESIRKLFKEGFWKSFYERYPNSGGYIVMSAVGFNPQRTQAVVYMGSACGGLCGRWSLHLLEKVDGKWKSVPGFNCITVS